MARQRKIRERGAFGGQERDFLFLSDPPSNDSESLLFMILIILSCSFFQRLSLDVLVHEKDLRDLEIIQIYITRNIDALSNVNFF